MEQIANAIIIWSVFLIFVAIYTTLICDNYRHADPVFGVVSDAAGLRNVNLPLYPQTLYGTGHRRISQFSNGTAFNSVSIVLRGEAC